MGVTSQLPLTYRNCCTAAPVSLLTNTPICKSTFHYLLPRNQSAQLHHLAECLVLHGATYLKLSGNPGSPWQWRLTTWLTEAWWTTTIISQNILPWGRKLLLDRHTPTPKGWSLTSTTGYLLSSKCRGDGNFPGEQPHQCLFPHSHR